MGIVSDGDTPVSQNPTLPFYWMTFHLLLAGMAYSRCFLGMGRSYTPYTSVLWMGLDKIQVDESALLFDRLGLFFFFALQWIGTWVFLYLTWRTDPGILDARRGSSPSSPSSSIAKETETVTNELRQRYNEVIESLGRDYEDPKAPDSDDEDTNHKDRHRPQLCHTCRIARPLRSKHCRVMRRCVLVFDHHCPFVGTTVGLYNYIYFYLFLVSFSLMGMSFVVAWVSVLHRSLTSGQHTFPKGLFVVGLYIGVYLLPVAGMAMYHTRLLLANISTNEQMNVRGIATFGWRRRIWGTVRMRKTKQLPFGGSLSIPSIRGGFGTCSPSLCLIGVATCWVTTIRMAMLIRIRVGYHLQMIMKTMTTTRRGRQCCGMWFRFCCLKLVVCCNVMASLL